MMKKHLENIMKVDDEVHMQLVKAILFLLDLIKKEEDADKLALYRQAMHFASRASDCLNRVLLLEYPDLEDDSED